LSRYRQVEPAAIAVTFDDEPAVVVVVEEGGGGPSEVVSVNDRLKLTSELEADIWWISTAIVLVPLCSSDGDALPGVQELPPLDEARVLDAMAPLGMLERMTSVPFTYTTAPSSRTRLIAAAVTFDASATSKVLRK